MPDIVRIPSLRLTELDGSPDVHGVERIYLTSGFMSSLGGGSVLLSMSGSGGVGSSVTIRDIDGAPNITPLNTLYVTNGFLSDLGSGNALLSMSGSGGGAPTTATYWVEDADGTLSNEVVVGTTGITTAAYGSRQAAAKAGRLFLPNNGFMIERDNGSAWAPWGPLFPLTAPIDADFSWVNQGGASVTTTNGGIFLRGPASASDNLRIRDKAAPATPYTITAGFLPAVIGTAAVMAAGLCFRESGTGEVVTFWVQQTGIFNVVKYTSPTVLSAGYAGTNLSWTSSRSGLVWLRIADDGANRICSYSMDGINFIVIHSVGRTDFLTADRVGFVVNTELSTHDVGMTLLSWKEA